jgi:hypothetical protein
MTKHAYFQLMGAVRPGMAIPPSLYYYEEKNELHISPHVRLCSGAKAAQIKDQALAERFADAILPRLQMRYGSEFELTINKVTSAGSEKAMAKVALKTEQDSELIRKRIETGNFAGNIAP